MTRNVAYLGCYAEFQFIFVARLICSQKGNSNGRKRHPICFLYFTKARCLVFIVSVLCIYWCLVMSFWLKVCIYSHTRGVKLGLGLGFMQTSQVLPHWLNQSFSFRTLSYTQRHCHVRIEKDPVQTVAIILEAHNFLEYHYMLYH